MTFVKVPPDIAQLQPGLAMGGFSACDGIVEFYTRVSLLTFGRAWVYPALGLLPASLYGNLYIFLRKR